MALLTVHVREDLYFEDDVLATVTQDRLDENAAFLELKRGTDVIEHMTFDTGYYQLSNVSAILRTQFDKHGINPKEKYTVKTFTYIVSPAVRTRKITFEVTGDEQMCWIRYMVNDSKFSRCVSLNLDFADVVSLRYYLDNLFQYLVGPEYA